MSTNIPDNAPRRILDIDESIRFVGFTDKSCKNMVYEYRENVEPLLTEKELREQSTIQVQLMNNIDLEPKLGRPIFLSILYEKIKLATILLDNSNLLTLSFDIGADHQSIILDKILPMVKKGW